MRYDALKHYHRTHQHQPPTTPPPTPTEVDSFTTELGWYAIGFTVVCGIAFLLGWYARSIWQ